MGEKGKSSFYFHLAKSRYNALFSKAKLECKTANPLHDVLDLLLTYYLENTFVVHRKMRAVEELSKGSLKYRVWTTRIEEIKERKKVYVIITKDEKRRLTMKTKRDGINSTHLVNMLIDFYMKDEFFIETKIIRVNK